MGEFYQKGGDFQELLKEHNKTYGDSNYIEFARESGAGEFGTPLQRDQMPDVWEPFNEVEEDRIRHYYGQKLAVEEEGPLVGSAYMLGHEGMGTLNELLVGKLGWGSETTGIKGSLYDLYVNALALVDYGVNKGPSGMDFYNRLKSREMSDEEFKEFGDTALERIGYER